MAAVEIHRVIELELALASPGVGRTPALVEELLETGFREVGASGRIWTRSEAVQAMAAEATGDQVAVEVTDMEATALGTNLVLLTYVSNQDGRRACRSSLWRRSDGTWRLVFHQGTSLA